jgi:DNA polymerase III delta subunit
MKVDSLKALKQKVDAPVFLIVSPIQEERQNALTFFKKKSYVALNKENFSMQLFIREVDNMGFFNEEQTVIVEDLEQFDSKILEGFTDVVKRPRKGITLVFIATSFSTQSRLFKAIDQVGVCLKFKELKKWEREKEEVISLCAKAKAEGVVLSTDVATQWVKSLSGHEEMKQKEFEKVLCYLGGKGTITKEVLEELSAVPKEAPIWLLSDAVLARNLKSSHRLADHLLKESGSLFPLLAYMRSQFDLGLKLTEAYVSGGREKAQLVAPQLRGNFLDKKVQTFMGYGSERLKQGLQLIMKTELRAKSESIDTSLLFEILIAKLCA